MAESAIHVNVPLSQQRAMNDTLTRLAHFCYVCGLVSIMMNNTFVMVG